MSAGRAPATGPSGVLDVLEAADRPAPATLDADVLANEHLDDRYWKLSIAAPHVARAYLPGQFVMLTVTRSVRSGPVLPRPMAIYDADAATGRVDIVYSVVGAGTRALTSFGAGERIGVVGPLGRGFTPPPGDLLLLGRGIGTCSLTPLARTDGTARTVTAVASGRHPGAILGREVYAAHGARVLPVHDGDGSADPAVLEPRLRGLLDAAPPALIAACGSARLEALALRLAAAWGADVQVALEAHMACGLGYCHGCSTGDRTAAAEAPLICRDGPVFRLRAA
ncbi:MAG TPA: hypothetical protein VGL93_36145 [Streptosporangiaceae bacterium]|jgi:dihydroorotate dehydrogenase electron transfer subunit